MKLYIYFRFTITRQLIEMLGWHYSEKMVVPALIWGEHTLKLPVRLFFLPLRADAC